jgi:EAL domain-containing protein (putative c-di-GMP-specific phosphodiesterase class I)
LDAAAVSATGLRTPALMRATDRVLDAAASGVDVHYAAARAAVAEIADWCAIDVLRADGRLERAASAFGPGIEAGELGDSLLRFAIPDPALVERLETARGPVRIEDPDWLPHHRAVAAPVCAAAGTHGVVLALVPLAERGWVEDLWFAGEIGLRLAQVLELSGTAVPDYGVRPPEPALATRPSLLLEPIASVGSGEIAAAEVSGGGDLGAWAREEACRVAAELDMRGLGIRVGVDVALEELTGDGFVAGLERAASDAGAPPGSVIVEISGVAARMVGRGGGVLEDLRDAGFLVAIDDFGAGSALSADLLERAVDILKISPGLVGGANHDAPRAERLSAVAELARDLGLDVVAQGVSTEAEMALVSELGCRWAQGEAVGKPRRLGELIERAGARV